MTTTIEKGQELPPLTLPPVSRTTLALFAGASGDHNPIHIDLDFARKAGMVDVFAHGMLSLAWLGRLVTSWVPQSELRQLNARFTGITHLQNVITCRGKVTDIVEEGGERLAKIELSTTNQYGEVKIIADALVKV
jgi:acyl dehydratase